MSWGDRMSGVILPIHDILSVLAQTWMTPVSQCLYGLGGGEEGGTACHSYPNNVVWLPGVFVVHE